MALHRRHLQAFLTTLLLSLLLALTVQAADKCAKCNVPVSQGGCKCNSNCDCISSVDKCAKCNLAASQGGCSYGCDSNCDCITPTPSSSGSGCPSGWSPAVGTIFDSWPKPRTKECVDYSGCTWAGMFQTIDGGSGRPCKNGAQWLNGGNGNMACRFPESTVKNWNIAATYNMDSALLGQKLQVMVEGRPARVVTVNVRDVCSDSDCSGCCKTNTGNKKWKLIDIEKWPASTLLNFSPSPSNFDINNVNIPTAGGSRPGAPQNSVMPLCYKIVGPADKLV